MNFIGSKTRENVVLAFVKECESVRKYQIYSDQADADGNAIARMIFDRTRANEEEHSEIWFKLLHNNEVPNTVSNLVESVEGELFEHRKFYLNMAQVAEEEGFSHIAFLAREIADVEGNHAERFKKLLDPEIGNSETEWKCTECGHEWIGIEAPLVCPICGHAGSFSAIKNLYN